MAFIKEIILMILLITASIYDIKRMCIPRWLVLIHFVYALSVAVITIVTEDIPIIEYSGTLVAVVIMFMILILSVRTGQSVMGTGDIFLIISLCIRFGWIYLLLILAIALSAAGAYSGILIVIGRAGKKSRIPFIPFLTFGTAVNTFILIKGC